MGDAGVDVSTTFGIQSGPAEGLVLVGTSLTAFSATTNAIANGVRPGQISTETTVGTRFMVLMIIRLLL